MDSCIHKDSREKDWLPDHNQLLKIHPYCESCGVVKNSSTERGKEIGHFSNSLNKLRRYLEKEGYKLSKTQIRLILLEFENKGLADPYQISFSNQKEVFIEIVRKYVKTSKKTILGFL